MKKITIASINAFNNNQNFKSENMEVVSGSVQTHLYLHGNPIAIKNIASGSVFIQTCGWKTNTTKERLNALNGVSISQQKGQWFLNGQLWDGKLIEVKN